MQKVTNMKLPYFPLYVGDFSLGTEELTNAETGAYIRLLIHQWKNKSLPEQLTGKLVIHLDEWPSIEQYFPLCEDERRRNPRLEEEREKITDRREKQRLGGLKSAETRKQPTKVLTKQLPKLAPNIAESDTYSDSEEDSKTHKRKSVPQGGYLTKNGKVLTKKFNEAFNLFWKAFDYPKAKAAAADSWYNINWPEDSDEKNKLFGEIIKAAKKEAVDRPWQISQGNTPKYPQGWLTERRWEDE